MDVLILNHDDMSSLLSLDVVFQSVTKGCIEYSAGDAVVPQRIHLHFGKNEAEAVFMPGYLKKSKVFGMKYGSCFPLNINKKLPVGPGLLFLIDFDTGFPNVIMDASYLSSIRTGVLTALACRHLAKPSAQIAGILGSGTLARTQLLALAHEFNLKAAYIYSRNPNNVKIFIKEMQPRLNHIELKPARDAYETISSSEIVIAATTATKPIVLGSWLRPGLCICSIGSNTPEKREVDSEVIKKADIIVADSKDAVLKTAGDLIIPITESILSADRVLELGHILQKKHKCRTSENDIAFFKSVGFVAVDLAVAEEVFRNAKKRKIGTYTKLLQ
jgi:ornithine cyclodeaminase